MIADSGDHASILDGCKLSGARLRPFRHQRLDKLERMLERAAGDGGGVLVVVDGVYSMEGDVCDVDLGGGSSAGGHGARLMVDEAHGVGVLGARGAGASELHDAEESVDLRMGTFSKSLASCGGFIAGPGGRDRLPADRLASVPVHGRRRPRGDRRGAARRCGSAAPPRARSSSPGCSTTPPTCTGACRSSASGSSSPARSPDGTEVITPIVPVVIGDDLPTATLWKALWDAGLYTNVALYPAVPPGGSLIRTSVMATHEREHLDRALEIFSAAGATFQQG